jgi:preprotein translocase subunit SecF
LGFSLYDTIVVFDKVHENTNRFGTSRVSYSDIVNVSMNQVLMRSLNTSVAAVLPVLSLLILGSGVLGAVALQEFALALLVGLLTGTYSSIFIATPLLAILKSREPKFRSLVGQRSLKGDMTTLMQTGSSVSRKQSVRSGTDGSGAKVNPIDAVTAVLSHPPRPRKKTRR